MDCSITHVEGMIRENKMRKKGRNKEEVTF
jgi:hypothetical protein